MNIPHLTDYSDEEYESLLNRYKRLKDQEMREIFGVKITRDDFDQFRLKKVASPGVMNLFLNIINYEDINKFEKSRYIFFELLMVNYDAIQTEDDKKGKKKKQKQKEEQKKSSKGADKKGKKPGPEGGNEEEEEDEEEAEQKQTQLYTLVMENLILKALNEKEILYLMPVIYKFKGKNSHVWQIVILRLPTK